MVSAARRGAASDQAFRSVVSAHIGGQTVKLGLDVFDVKLAVHGCELEIRDLVDSPQPGETHLADLCGLDLPAGTDGRGFDPVDQGIDRLRADGTLVRGAIEAATQLDPIERLATAVALAHEQRLPVATLVCSEAMFTGRTLPPTTHGGSFFRAAALQNPAPLVSTVGASHMTEDTTSGVGYLSQTLHIAFGQEGDPRLCGIYLCHDPMGSTEPGALYDGEVSKGDDPDHGGGLEESASSMREKAAAARLNVADRAAHARENAAHARHQAVERAGVAREAAVERAGAIRDSAAETIRAVKPKFRGVSHEWAFFLSLGLGISLLVLADTPRKLLAVTIYTVSLCGLFCTSALYHRVNWKTSKARKLMKRLDHSMIFLLIAGTVTPFALLTMSGTWATAILIAVWAGAVIGVLIELLWTTSPKWVSAIIYVIVGWIGAVAFPQIVGTAGIIAGLLIATGGILYTIGAVVYATQRPDPNPTYFGYHEVFHLLVIAAAASHFAAIALFAL